MEILSGDVLLMAEKKSVKEQIKEQWTDSNWLWSAHQTASLMNCSIHAARRALRQLVKEGFLKVYGRNLSAGKTLWQKQS